MDEDLESYKRFDRAHPVPPEARIRIEARMMAALAEHSPPVDARKPEELELVPTDLAEARPQRSRIRPVAWLAAAAVVILFAAVWTQQQEDDTSGITDETAQIAEMISGYCTADVEPVADALDLLRVNPTAANAVEVVDTTTVATDALDALASALPAQSFSDRVEFAVASLRRTLSDIGDPTEAEASVVRSAGAQLGGALSGFPGADACPLERLTTPNNPVTDFYDGYSGD